MQGGIGTNPNSIKINKYLNICLDIDKYDTKGVCKEKYNEALFYARYNLLKDS